MIMILLVLAAVAAVVVAYVVVTAADARRTLEDLVEGRHYYRPECAHCKREAS